MMATTKKKITGLALMLILLFAIFVYSNFNPSENILFPKCPVYAFSGYKCPGCGSQRAFHHLFQGNFITAFRYNPLMFIVVPYIFAGIYIEYIAPCDKKAVHYIRNTFYNKWAVCILLLSILLYSFLRNI